MPTFIELNKKVDESEKPENRKKNKLKLIFCTKLSKGIIVSLLFALLIPTIAYYFVISRHVIDDDTERYYCLVQEEFRLPCGTSGFTQKQCESAKCCYNSTTKQCHHYLPSKYFYRKQIELDESVSYQSSEKTTPFGVKLVPEMALAIQEKNKNTLSIIIYNTTESVKSISLNNNFKHYSTKLSDKKLALEVMDKDNDVIFTSSKSALISSDRYLEWSFQLSNETVFGLDRNLIRLKPNETLTKVIYKNWEDHITLPVFWALQKGKFHGCIIRHDGPLEIEVLASNTIILRSLLGKKLEVELSVGPTPAELYRQQAVPVTAQPLWAMGTHICRKGESLDLTSILNTYLENSGTVFDTDCLHENLFLALQMPDINSTAIRAKISEMIKSENTKFLLYLPPHILIDAKNPLYVSATKEKILYKYQSGVVYNGTYLGHQVVYPDYSAHTISNYLESLVDFIQNQLGLENISGFVLNDNWPQDDSYYGNVEEENFQYFSDNFETQMKFTLPWTLEGVDKVLHLETHNSYGSFQNRSLYGYLNSTVGLKDIFIVSSTKNLGEPQPELSNNLPTSWESFRNYLNMIMFNSVSGNPLVGLPICGDSNSYNKKLHEVLCMRWYLAASTMPYFVVSSDDPFRDPTNLNSKTATKVADAAISKRKFLQEYFYTIMSKQEPLVRPMYYDYYNSSATFEMENQYTVGKDLLVAHPFSSGQVKLQVYLPPERGAWYELFGGSRFTPNKKNYYYVEVDNFENDLTIFMAQGTIVPMTDSNKIHLYIALDCSKDGCLATGDLLKDGTQYVTFVASNESVTISHLPANCTYILGSVKVYGYGDAFTGEISSDLCSDGPEKRIAFLG